MRYNDQAGPARVLQGISQALAWRHIFCADVQADSTHAGNMDHLMGPALYSISTSNHDQPLAYGGDGLGTCWHAGRQDARRCRIQADETKTVEATSRPTTGIARK
jgi:hypothetical protein